MTHAATDDPLLHVFWEDITDRALAVVEAEGPAIAARLRKRAPWAITNCEMASTAWLRAFRGAGVPVIKVEGNYYPESGRGLASWPSSSDHVWLRVDGHLFDPTAGQFKKPRSLIASRWYHTGPPAG